MALKLPPEAHNQSPLFGALWAIFMIRGLSKFILQKDATLAFWLRPGAPSFLLYGVTKSEF